MKALVLLFAVTVAPPAEREIPLAGGSGARLFVSDGAGGDPVARIAAARAALAARLGTPLVGNRITRRTVKGVAFATVSDRFPAEPRTIHGWMAVATSASLCHITVPAEAAAAIRPALARCSDILLGPPATPPSPPQR